MSIVIVTRTGKGSELEHSEVDNNFLNLKNAVEQNISDIDNLGGTKSDKTDVYTKPEIDVLIQNIPVPEVASNVIKAYLPFPETEDHSRGVLHMMAVVTDFIGSINLGFVYMSVTTRIPDNYNGGFIKTEKKFQFPIIYTNSSRGGSFQNDIHYLEPWNGEYVSVESDGGIKISTFDPHDSIIFELIVSEYLPVNTVVSRSINFIPLP